MRLLKIYTAISLLFFIYKSNAQQFNLNAEIRPRFEYRNGYKTLTPNAVNAATFVSQRTRLNFGYKNKDVNTYISLQNTRTWGDVSTLSPADINGIALHQAWAEAILGKWRFKLGRQEIVYDDHRIFGNVGWAQQARSHDALILKYLANPNNRLDVGIALNENSESLFDKEYTVNNYKAFQYLWYNTKFSNINISFLFLNSGFAYDDASTQKTAYNQTFGTTGTITKSKWNANASIYVQTGKIKKTDLSALNASINFNFKVNKELLIGVGAEYLSGTNMNETDGKTHSFTPLFGTNHKFNGFMDYFYVGNHNNSVGLVDINAKLKYTKNKVSVSIMPHFFSSSAKIIDISNIEKDNYLGTEIDFTLGYKVSKDIAFNIGYSQIFASESMRVLKGENTSKTNNWAWTMVTFKPTFFRTQKE